MDTPVFKLYLGKFTLEAVTAPDERKAEVMARHAQIGKDTGLRMLINGTVWSDERYRMFGVEMYPSWQALFEHDRCLDELGWFQYVNARTFIGVAPENYNPHFWTVELDPAEKWLTQIWITRNMPDVEGSEEWQNTGFKPLMELEQSLGVRNVLLAEVRAVDEINGYFGIQLFPSLEALVTKTRAQAKVNWWRYIQGEAYLGVAEGGELIKK